jgi:hypothetical protein
LHKLEKLDWRISLFISASSTDQHDTWQVIRVYSHIVRTSSEFLWLVVPVTFGHPWRSCCFCLEKCPGLWLLVVSLGGLQRPERRARHRRSSRAELPSSRAEIIPGPVGLNGGPRHRRSGPGGAATRALRLVTDAARHAARRARVRGCRAGPVVCLWRTRAPSQTDRRK